MDYKNGLIGAFARTVHPSKIARILRISLANDTNRVSNFDRGLALYHNLPTAKTEYAKLRLPLSHKHVHQHALLQYLHPHKHCFLLQDQMRQRTIMLLSSLLYHRLLSQHCILANHYFACLVFNCRSRNSQH